MAIATFADLRTAVLDEIDRAGDADMSDRVLRWAQITTAKANRLLRTQDGVCRATATTTADDPYLDLPSNYNGATEIRLVEDGASTPLFSRDNLQIADDSTDELSGKPEGFSRVGGALKLYPIPDDEYTIELWQFEKLEDLIEDDDTNWLLTDHPDAYMGWCVFLGYRLLKDMESAAPYADDFNRIIGEIRVSDDFNARSEHVEAPEFF